MRILLTADPEIPVPPVTYGGIERIVDGLVAALRGLGHRVGLVAHPDSRAASDAFYPWPGAASRGTRDTLRNARTLTAAARDFRPDVLHSFSRLAYLAALLPTRLPKVMSYQREPSLRTTTLARRLSGGTLRFTGCSDYICRLGRRAGGDWAAVPNFVDPAKYAFAPAVAADAPLVFLSRVEPIKGAHLAIEVARRAGRRLVLAGNRSEAGPLGDYWRDQIQPHLGEGVEGGAGVEYVGPVNDAEKSRLLGGAAAMLVPVQWDEPFGIVFAESLACGTPVLSCPRGALPEIVRDGVEGFLADTVEGLVEAVGRLGAIDRGACRRRVEAHFSQAAVADRYVELYRRATGTRPEPSGVACRAET